MLGLLIGELCLGGLGLAPPSRLLVMVLRGFTGVGLGMVMAVTQIISQVAAGPARLGAAAAVISLSRNPGAPTGSAAFGAIAFTGSAPGPGLGGGVARAAGSVGFSLAFLAAAAICLAGAWSASRLPRDRLGAEPAASTTPRPDR